MKAKSNQLTVESMTQRYSLGHKALSVALSVVLMGWLAGGFTVASVRRRWRRGRRCGGAGGRRLVRCGHEHGRQGR